MSIVPLRPDSDALLSASLVGLSFDFEESQLWPFCLERADSGSEYYFLA